MVLNTIAVTGASGMLGHHVLAALEDAGLSIAAASRSRPDGLAEAAKWTSWDLLEWKTPDQLDRIFGDVDAVIHAGAIVPRPGQDASIDALFKANVEASLALGSWAMARKLPFLYVSGAVVYADPSAPGIPETAATSPVGFGGYYKTTKLLAEQALRGLIDLGLGLCILRPSSIYGSRLPKGKMISGFLAAAARDEVIHLQPPTDDRINLVHADDVAGAAISALSAHANGIFNVSGPRLVSIEEIARACVVSAGRGKIVIDNARSSRPPTSRFDLDINQAATAFGYAPKIDIAVGLEILARQ